jgi:hypothetical protein
VSFLGSEFPHKPDVNYQFSQLIKDTPETIDKKNLLSNCHH